MIGSLRTATAVVVGATTAILLAYVGAVVMLLATVAYRVRAWTPSAGQFGVLLSSAEQRRSSAAVWRAASHLHRRDHSPPRSDT